MTLNFVKLSVQKLYIKYTLGGYKFERLFSLTGKSVVTSSWKYVKSGGKLQIVEFKRISIEINSAKVPVQFFCT